MSNQQKSLRVAIVALIFGVSAMILSCSKNADPISSQVTQLANNESTQDAQQDEVDDISTNALGTTDSPTGKTEGPFIFTDHRLGCAIVTRDTSAFKTKGSGKITIDLGTGCTDKHGNVRAGKIIISWSGGRCRARR